MEIVINNIKLSLVCMGNCIALGPAVVVPYINHFEEHELSNVCMKMWSLEKFLHKKFRLKKMARNIKNLFTEDLT